MYSRFCYQFGGEWCVMLALKEAGDHGDVVFLTAPRVVVASFYGAEMALSSDLRDFLYHAVAESASWPLGGCSWSW